VALKGAILNGSTKSHLKIFLEAFVGTVALCSTHEGAKRMSEFVGTKNENRTILRYWELIFITYVSTLLRKKAYTETKGTIQIL